MSQAIEKKTGFKNLKKKNYMLTWKNNQYIELVQFKKVKGRSDYITKYCQ